MMYDLAVIGSGPGGHTAAKHAATLGKKVCLIEKKQLGGTCLNTGCIPTKFMVHTSDILANIKKACKFGIEVSEYKFDILKMQKQREAAIDKLRSGIEPMLKSKKIDIVQGEARLKNRNTIDVSGKEIKAEYIIIATGSTPVEVDGLRFDNKNIISSEGLLNLEKLPASILIVGAGYIGCEFACIFNSFGSKVTMVELEGQILPRQDREIAKRLSRSMQNRGISVLLKSKIKSLKPEGSNAVAIMEDGNKIEAEKVLLTIGRRPDTKNLGLESIGVKLGKGGEISVNDNLRTNVDNIYAVGDVAGRFFLAYTAAYEGDVASDNICSQPRTAMYYVVPGCIFTSPQYAYVGLTEDEAKQKGIEIKKISHSFAASSKAQIMDETEGLIKLIIEAKNNRILGAQILGPDATELIAELALAINNKMTVSGLLKTLHAHPTLYESIFDALTKAN